MVLYHFLQSAAFYSNQPCCLITHRKCIAGILLCTHAVLLYIHAHWVPFLLLRIRKRYSKPIIVVGCPPKLCNGFCIYRYYFFQGILMPAFIVMHYQFNCGRFSSIVSGGKNILCCSNNSWFACYPPLVNNKAVFCIRWICVVAVC